MERTGRFRLFVIICTLRHEYKSYPRQKRAFLYFTKQEAKHDDNYN